ncbi:arginine N-succinyltransferase beta subunit, partial [Vibrio parahaemolyticus V-223/04]
TLRQNSA